MINMAEGKEVRRLEQILNTIQTADKIFRMNDLFEHLQKEHTKSKENRISIKEQITNISLGISTFFAEFERKIDYLNIANLKKNLDGKLLGNIFLEKLNNEIQKNNLSISEAYFLTNTAYYRVEKHFDPGGKYHPEHKGKDDLLHILPKKYSELKRQMLLPAGSGAFMSEQIERLNLFLMYLQFSDRDFNIDNLISEYQKFEEDVAFCKTIPPKFLNIYENMEVGFSGSWKKYKLFEKDKTSEHYEWINKIQEFEKTHPYIGASIRIYVMDYNQKKIIEKTQPFEAKSNSQDIEE